MASAPDDEGLAIVVNLAQVEVDHKYRAWFVSARATFATQRLVDNLDEVQLSVNTLK